MTTEAEFWIDQAGTGRWRTSRRAQWCTHQRRGEQYTGEHCPAGDETPAIQPGDRYLDTGEVVQMWATVKVCATCAAREIPPSPWERDQE